MKKSLSIKLVTSALLITFAVSLQSAGKTEESKDKKKPGNANGSVFPDSCGKESKGKCGKEKEPELKTPDYSKSIK